MMVLRFTRAVAPSLGRCARSGIYSNLWRGVARSARVGRHLHAGTADDADLTDATNTALWLIDNSLFWGNGVACCPASPAVLGAGYGAPPKKKRKSTPPANRILPHPAGIRQIRGIRVICRSSLLWPAKPRGASHGRRTSQPTRTIMPYLESTSDTSPAPSPPRTPVAASRLRRPHRAPAPGARTRGSTGRSTARGSAGRRGG